MLFEGGYYMKALKLNDLQSESQVFTEMWAFLKTHAVPENDEDWRQIVEEGKQLVSNCKNRQSFAQSMFLCIYEELERQDKQRKNRHNLL